ncbi:hypothetical protein Pyrde_1040 [Pyrodictium delaneyi]|uniref:Uncharacterized protein n=1 Tax=Pyrodictium delaneyi TaxID=1273541 RepID=A0A0P0N3T5_9CREN|nr:hypothetical protein Pyrde_1040 [Pyrodictium delaneyi]
MAKLREGSAGGKVLTAPQPSCVRGSRRVELHHCIVDPIPQVSEIVKLVPLPVFS